jgi:hypothetical protein
MDCDVLLLTEVPDPVHLTEFELHRGRTPMAPARNWAAVASRRPLEALSDPHGASAMVEVDGLRICASILPWRTCGSGEPWIGATTAQRTAAAVEAVEAATPTVWGGDWNHALTGPEWSGSKEGRRDILGAVQRLSLQVPTADAPHQIDGLLSIDHIAVPASWSVRGVEHYTAFVDGARISDHDAYVVELA